MPSSTSSPDGFDEIRAANPELGFGVYALEPGGRVKLEIYTPDEQVFQFDGATLAEALAAAFPPAPAEPDPEPAIDVFA